MRSTKASAAVERLKRRSGDTSYSMSLRSDGQFALFRASASGPAEPVGVPLPLDAFVSFVNGLQAAPSKPASKLDVAFREQLKKK